MAAAFSIVRKYPDGLNTESENDCSSHEVRP
jgi:hypothetical protein